MSGVREPLRRARRGRGRSRGWRMSRQRKTAGPRSHDGTIIAERVGAMLGTDLPTTITDESRPWCLVEKTIDGVRREEHADISLARWLFALSAATMRLGTNRCVGGGDMRAMRRRCAPVSGWKLYWQQPPARCSC